MRSARLVRVKLALAVGLFALAGCLQLLGIEGDVTVHSEGVDASADSATPASNPCGLAPADPSCEACLNAQCCPQMAACAAVPECASFENCVLSCGTDYVCRARCNSADASRNFGEIPPLEACVTNKCQSQCGITCGVVESVTNPDAALACQACVASSPNCAVAEACGQSVECIQVAQCEGACVGFDCQQACSIGRDAGAALLSKLEGTLAAACLDPCQFGQSWACVGHIVVPFLPTPTLVTVTVTTIEGTAVAGATVKACSGMDKPCASPIATGTTDANGAVALTVRGPLPIGNGFGGYFDIAPAEPSDGAPPQIVPFLEFLAYPFTEPTATFATTALTPADLAALTVAGKVTLDGGGPTGDIVIVGFDCGLHPASGVTFEATSGTLDLTSQIRYLSGITPDPKATATNSAGIGLLFGAPALAPVTLTATPAVLGYRSGTATAFARSGSFSIVSVPPQ